MAGCWSSFGSESVIFLYKIKSKTFLESVSKEPFKKDDNHPKKIAKELLQPVVGLLFELKWSFSYIK